MTSTESVRDTNADSAPRPTHDPTSSAGPGRTRTRQHSRTARPRSRRPRSARLDELAYYGGLFATTTVFAMYVVGLFARPFRVPVAYAGDGLAGGAQVKGVLENGWYESNPALGAPFGLEFHDFPLADNLQFVMTRFFGLFTDDWGTVYNLDYLVTFPLSALAAAWFIRTVGGSRVVAFAFGALFAFAPYHFIHGQQHLSLSMMFPIPLFAVLLVKVLADRPIWARRTGSRWNPLVWATPLTAGTLLIVGVLGTTSSYYAVFGLLLASVVVVVTLLRRHTRRALGLVVAMGGLVTVMLINMAPDILHARSVSASPAAFGRSAIDSEIYALKLTQLLYPSPLHRVEALADLRMGYDRTFPNPAEDPTLGVVAAVGFLFLLALPLVVALLRRPVAPDGPLGRTQQDLALLTLVCFLFGTAGGFGTVFAIVVSPDIRGWNRISAYLALFALTSCALLLDALARRLDSRTAAREQTAGSHRDGVARWLGPQSVAAVALIAAVAAVGLWDATPSGRNSTTAEDVRRFDVDAAYVAAIEQEVPAGTAVFEMPFLPYPESQPGEDMEPYDPMRPYLHSDDLRWSYGGLAGRPRADWQITTSGLPPTRLAVALVAAGFGGIHVDRYGYPDRDAGQLESDLRQLVGEPLVSADNRFAFYDLAPLRESVEQIYDPAEIAQIKRAVLRQPVFYWQPGFTGPPTPDASGELRLDALAPEAEGVVYNPGRPTRLRMRFVIQVDDAEDYPTPVEVTWPDGKTKVVEVSETGTKVARTLRAPSGQHALQLDAEPGVGLHLTSWLFDDPGLDFPLRGAAARVASADAATTP